MPQHAGRTANERLLECNKSPVLVRLAAEPRLKIAPRNFRDWRIDFCVLLNSVVCPLSQNPGTLLPIGCNRKAVGLGDRLLESTCIIPIYRVV